MAEWTGERKIKYEAELDAEFPREIMAMPGGENLAHCIQCGTCSGACPMSIYMDYTPRRIIAMTRAGFKDEVLHSFTIWLCASCYACTVECPKEIQLTDIMYSLKQKAIQEKVHPRRFTIPILAREFFKAVLKWGRSTESSLILRMYLKSNPFALLKQAPLGLKLWLRGRMGLKREAVPAANGARGDLQKLLRAVDEQQAPSGSGAPIAATKETS